jgi:hypothetical protein
MATVQEETDAALSRERSEYKQNVALMQESIDDAAITISNQAQTISDQNTKIAEMQARIDELEAENPTDPEEPAPTVVRRMGMYNGNPSENPDENYKQQFGAENQITSSYYTGQAPNVNYELSRVAKGISVYLDFDTKNTPGQINLISKRDPNTLNNWLRPDLNAAQKIAEAAKGGAEVTVSFVHEWEVKTAQAKFSGYDADPVIYGKAFAVFIEEARKLAPDCKIVYWMGNSANDWQTRVGTAIKQMLRGPDKVSWDPYVTVRKSPSMTPLELFQPVHDWWLANEQYKAWGSPDLAISEFGIATQHGDDACAAFYSKVGEAMEALDILEVIQFNRDKGEVNGNWKITGGTTPKAKGAFKAEAASVAAG